MSKKLIVGLGLLCILVITTGSSCNRTPFNGVTKTVNINGGCQVSAPSVTIGRKDQVSWTANTETNTILFPASSGSPFTNITAGTPYSIPQNTTKSSGPVAAAASGSYKYTVAGNSGCSNDPIVIIHP